MSAPLTKTADEFYLALCDSRLLSVQQMESLKAARPREAVDGAAWVAELVERHFLTDFQAEQLLAGESGCLVLGQYRILDRLGTGGMGHVYKAEHTVMKRVVALKVIAAHLVKDASAVARFHHEVELAARLSHPNIITAYDAAEANGLHFLVMEYVEGTDLGRCLKESGPLPIMEACEYVRQTALGLQHAFESGLVHCDIKPANLLVRPSTSSAYGAFATPQVKILDFGLARLAGSPSASISLLSKSGADTHFAGTPDYIAPEQARDCQAADIRSDLYSLGCTFYHLLAGQVPFPGGTWSEKILRHQFDLAPRVLELRPDVPEAVEDIIHRLLAKNPQDRYQVPVEVADALRTWLCTQSHYGGDVIFSVPPLSSARTPHGGDGSTVLTPTPAKRCVVQSQLDSALGLRDASAMSLAAGTPRIDRRMSVFSRSATAAAAVMLGLGIALLALPTPQKTWRPGDALALQGQPALNLFSVDSKPGVHFTGLELAVAAARDGDTILIHGDGPFYVPPISIQGKSLTIKAAEKCRPTLEFNRAGSDAAWQALLLTDRPLALVGLDLLCSTTSNPGGQSDAAHLVYSHGASLRLADCRLSALDGSALVVCRNPSHLELHNCSLQARASAICVEVGRNAVPELHLINSSVTTSDAGGAALSLWTTEPRKATAVHLRLEGTKIEAGRVIALAGPVQGLHVTADGNEFTFHQALLSCAGFGDAACWRQNSPWHGADNRYHGPGAWLMVNGNSVDVNGLADWREFWRMAQAQVPQSAPVPSFKTSLREPAD